MAKKAANGKDEAITVTYRVLPVQAATITPAPTLVPTPAPVLIPRCAVARSETFSHGFKLGLHAVRHFARNLQRAQRVLDSDKLMEVVVNHVLGLGK